MSAFSNCVQCGRRLRDAVFCPECGLSTCSWKCHVQHTVAHEHPAVVPEPAAWDSPAGVARVTAGCSGGSPGKL